MRYFLEVLAIFYFLTSQSIFAQTGGDRLLNQAKEHLASGKLGEAIDLVNKYVSANPDEPSGYNLRGQVFEKRRNFEAAVRDYISASKLSPANKEYARNLLRAREEWDKILVNRLEGYKREIAINPQEAENYLQAARAYRDLGDFPAAEKLYDEYLERKEASADEILRYTEVLAKNEKYKKGLPVLKRYTDNYPEDHRLWSRYGYFNLWGGIRSTAIKAFEQALKIRPFFKEAEEGLAQAKGKGFNYTYTSRRRGAEEYPIDRLYREVKKNPENNEVRLELVNELIKHNRIEEAYQQLQILLPHSSSIPGFSGLWEKVSELRLLAHQKEINLLKKKYNAGSSVPDVLLNLARRYSYIEEYDSSAFFYKEYLQRNPGSMEARLEYSKVLAWDLDYEKSKREITLLLSLDPDNTEYQLLYATLSVWMLKDLDKAGEYLENILAKNPYDLEAIIISIAYNIEKRNFEAAGAFIAQANALSKGNERVVRLESDLELARQRAEEERIFQILEEGRVLAMKNQCKKALELYDKYLPNVDPGRMVVKEYADVSACAGNYQKALELYNKLLEEEYDFETDLQRAKVYYWMGDSLKAHKEFDRLYSSHPDNFDVRMYLGDTFTQLKMYAEARKIYNTMLASGLDSAKTELITMRIGWLPVKGTGFGSFPDYLMITPSTLYFNDNFDFTYNSQSLRVDAGLTPYLTIAPEVSFGFISSDAVTKRFKAFKGNLLLRFSAKLTAGGGAGSLMFPQFEEKTIADAFIKYEKPESYSASMMYFLQDASMVLYSPYLLQNRLTVNLIKFSGFYRFGSGIQFSANVSGLNVSDRNKGLILELDAGKYFFDRLYAGYEFYGTSFERVSRFYYSPDQQISHSLTAEFDLAKEKVNRFTIGGKLGLIAHSDFILKEIFAGGIYSIFRNFAVQARITYSSTLQNELGYSSFSAQMAAYWLF